MISIGLAAAPVWACGGFFCDGAATTPSGNTVGVEQAGETVVFEVDGDTIHTHVTVTYQGPADQFAWVIPVPGEPTLEVSPQALFDGLHSSTATTVFDQQTGTGCRASSDGDADTDADADADADVDLDYYGTADPEVLIVSEDQVGPYDSVVLQALDADALVTWLQDNGYGVPDTLTDAVAPYLAPQMHFLALKLAKQFESGDLTPIRISYAGERPSIPIQLTSVAATEDMPLTVYVLGETRAVPLSYLHIELNPIVWYLERAFPNGVPGEPGSLDRHIGTAVDEAGGRGFVTLYAAIQSVPTVSAPGWFELSGLDTLPAHVWLREVMRRPGFATSAELLSVLRVHIPAPDGVDEADFYACPQCYEASMLDFDPVVATEDLDAIVVQPSLEAQEMLDRSPIVTRMQSIMSPGEMTVDPVFGFNPDLPRVVNTRSTVLRNTCTNGASTWALDLPGDYTIAVPQGFGLDPWLTERMIHTGIMVEQMSESGPGEVIADHRGELVWASLKPIGDGVVPADSCGCRHGVPPGLAGLIGLGLLRRRRRASPGR